MFGASWEARIVKIANGAVPLVWSGPAEPLGLDACGWIAEPDEVLGNRLDKAGRPADERERMLAGWPGGFCQHRGIHPACVTGPAGRLTAGQRADHPHAVTVLAEFAAVDHVGQGAG